MPAIAKTILRIAAVLCAVLGCAWGAGPYSDDRSFERRNADALAVCATFSPGMPQREAERRANAIASATVATVNENLDVKIVRENPCVVEFAAGVVGSAAVPRND